MPETASVTEFAIGTGEDIIRNIVEVILEETTEEVLFVTCFWAFSSSQAAIADALRRLSAKVTKPVTIRICFSSRGVLQKLFHTSSCDGKVLNDTEWPSLLGLPSPDQIPMVDLQVKSIFIKPISVLHPKYVLIDRQTTLLPSCNVSWEDWFEGCTKSNDETMAQAFFRHWCDVWQTDNFTVPDHLEHRALNSVRKHPCYTTSSSSAAVDSSQQPRLKSKGPTTKQLDMRMIYHFLPSQHHSNPHFRPLPCQRVANAPDTPLNFYTLTLLNSAIHSIFMTTPNLTSPPVLNTLWKALIRGVNVHIITNEKLMRNEQLITAGTTTARCLRKLQVRYRSAMRGQIKRDEDAEDLEHGTLVSRLGKLQIETPTQLHLKCTIVDARATILGSGNMDRASWYTSGELGVAFESVEFATCVHDFVLERLCAWSH